MSSQAEGHQESSPALTLRSGPLIQGSSRAPGAVTGKVPVAARSLLEGQACLLCQFGALIFGMWHEDLGFSGLCGLVPFLSVVLSF